MARHIFTGIRVGRPTRYVCHQEKAKEKKYVMLRFSLKNVLRIFLYVCTNCYKNYIMNVDFYLTLLQMKRKKSFAIRRRKLMKNFVICCVDRCSLTYLSHTSFFPFH